MIVESCTACASERTKSGLSGDVSSVKGNGTAKIGMTSCNALHSLLNDNPRDLWVVARNCTSERE